MAKQYRSTVGQQHPQAGETPARIVEGADSGSLYLRLAMPCQSAETREAEGSRRSVRRMKCRQVPCNPRRRVLLLPALRMGRQPYRQSFHSPSRQLTSGRDVYENRARRVPVLPGRLPPGSPPVHRQSPAGTLPVPSEEAGSSVFWMTRASYREGIPAGQYSCVPIEEIDRWQQTQQVPPGDSFSSCRVSQSAAPRFASRCRASRSAASREPQQLSRLRGGRDAAARRARQVGYPADQFEAAFGKQAFR